MGMVGLAEARTEHDEVLKFQVFHLAGTSIKSERRAVFFNLVNQLGRPDQLKYFLQLARAIRRGTVTRAACRHSVCPGLDRARFCEGRRQRRRSAGRWSAAATT